MLLEIASESVWQRLLPNSTKLVMHSDFKAEWSNHENFLSNLQGDFTVK